MAKILRSAYATYIYDFISLKRKLGFAYSTQEHVLSHIDLLAYQTNQTSKGITREFAELWSKRRNGESEKTRYIRIANLARLSSYISDLGVASYPPPLPPPPKNDFVPYIFSQDEIFKLFDAADQLVMNKWNPILTLLSVPLQLRFLYSTGVRSGEAKHLRNKDVNLRDRYVRIQDSKNGKERIIPISNSLTKQCISYGKYKKNLPIGSQPGDSFFVNASGNPITKGINYWFNKCLENIKLRCDGKSQRPRVHDLRHTFAVTSLAKMAKSGVDLFAALPILSTYLGHESIESTEHYVRLTSIHFPDLITEMDMMYLNVFPKYPNYEAD